ncbi:DUF362 domain-containing protein [bacterium]|nr:DUF362 domain-containing protein [bacterium]
MNASRNSEHEPGVCPRTGRIIGEKSPTSPSQWKYPRLLYPFAGLLALLWFLVRVIPKPSRAAYPCLQAAFPLAASFVTYLVGLAGMLVFFKNVGRNLRRARYALAAASLIVALVCAGVVFNLQAQRGTAEAFVPIDAPNTPMGTAKGIFPGRVAWDQNPDATDWDPSLDVFTPATTVFHWDDQHTNQAAVDQMMSNTVRHLTGTRTVTGAWDRLFRSFNENRGKGNTGYGSNEKIAIKPNSVDQRCHLEYYYGDGNYHPHFGGYTPQVLVALLKQLVWEAGIPEENITVCDSTRFISDKVYTRCHALFPNVIYMEKNYTDGQDAPGQPAPGTEGRVLVVPSPQARIIYSGKDKSGNTIPADRVPMAFVEADYVINLGAMKGHSGAGATLCGKNWYGMFCENPDAGQHSLLPSQSATPEYGHYRVITDLMGHADLGGKTVLYILDGLWGFAWHGTQSPPVKWQNTPFNNDYPSCILMSQDPVAIDSVGVDLLRAEFGEDMGANGLVGDGAIDDYLHEAALADDPPSATTYDPENDGTPFVSLGVHEHWNNPLDKQYTRNLETGDGIELVFGPPSYEAGVELWETYR